MDREHRFHELDAEIENWSEDEKHFALWLLLRDFHDAIGKEIPETIDTIGMKGKKFRIQISPKDCTGCGVCVNTCPVLKKALKMQDDIDYFNKEEANYIYSQDLKKEKSIFNKFTSKGIQFYEPYFEYSYACAGCGETPYIKLLTQLFGDNMIIANATGCSSIYGGSYPVCPYSKDKNGNGPSWANSLFEDNAEFGYGIKLGLNIKRDRLLELLNAVKENNFRFR